LPRFPFSTPIRGWIALDDPGPEKTKDIQRLTGLSWSPPMYFYPMMFLATYQIADLFENSRSIVAALMKLAR
jgi:hypothetical protein